MMCTFDAYLVRNMASSIPDSPPHTTAIRCSIKNAPSHVAQYETPFPAKVCSPTIPIFLGVAPVQTIIVFDSNSSEAVKTLNGLCRKSTSTTVSYTHLTLPTNREV